MPRSQIRLSGEAQVSTRAVSRARAAVFALFLTNGALFANLIPRYPSIKDDLGLSNTAFGAAVAAFPLGALAAGVATAALLRRFGSARVAVYGTAMLSIAIAAISLAPSWALLIVAFGLAGALDAVADVAQNAQGLRVQRAYGRSILNSFHAAWSAGAVCGGLLGSAAAGLDVPLPLQLSISGSLLGLVALGARRFLLPGKDHADHEAAGHGGKQADRSSRNPGRMTGYLVLAGLVLIAWGGAAVEDGGSAWSALYLNEVLGVAPAIAGLGFVAMIGMQFVGRILGDRLVDRYGQRAVAQAGALLTLCGTGCALLFPSAVTAITGFGASGLGIATLVPAVIHAANEIPGFRPGTGLALMNWLMRLGSLAVPPLIGMLADIAGLRTGLLVLPTSALIVLGASFVLTPRTSAHASSTSTPPSANKDQKDPESGGMARTEL